MLLLYDSKVTVLLVWIEYIAEIYVFVVDDPETR